MEDKLLQIAIEIIYYAGNARKLVTDALTALKEKDANTAKLKLEQAEVEIRLAHASQSNLLQQEAEGDSMPVSLLMVHAQSTLMVAMSEQHMAQAMIEIVEAYSKSE